MCIWISSVLLATLVVSGLSFPHPDDLAYKIPEVGTGRRSQYYVLHSDGTFKYGFDSGDGAFESVKSHSVGSKEGKFGYVDPDGRTIRLEYVAGEGGFVARGDHLPKPSPELARALAEVVRSNTPFVDPLASERSDASYGFRFDSADHSRNEQSDSDGTVTGSYSYVDENGVRRSFTYRAGKGIGFVIEGDGLTQDVGSIATHVQPKISTKSSLHAGVRQDTSFKTSQRTQTPSRPLGGSVRAYASYSGSSQPANVVSTRSETPGDASYSFSYNAGDHSRSESSDSNLNVDGKFSFVADDGQQREVTYVAGSQTGFQAKGDHLPKEPETEFGDRFPSSVRSSIASKPVVSFRKTDLSQDISRQTVHSSSSGVTRGFKFQTPSVRTGETSYQQTRTQQQAAVDPVVRVASFPQVFETANVRSSLTPAGPYSFSYDTATHSRSESGNGNNEVKGNFAFVAQDDGLRREINYEAGSDTGFIAEGEHIPIGPIVPGAPSGQPTGRIVPVPSVRFVDPLADTDTDASYNFGFDSDTYSRSETADKDGNVVGTYTVVNEDGTRVTYRFRAGKGIGYETEEISRVQGPKPSPVVPYRGPLAGGRNGVRLEVPKEQHTAPIIQQDLTRSSVGISTPFRQSFVAPASTTGFHTKSQTHFKSSPAVGIKSSFTPTGIVKSSLSPSTLSHEFPGFVLHRYAHSPTSEKFGYVLKFD
ncbi:UNVERIFIED_CONTAM: hypothetical protein RMT77_008105 [Armadillidium vulgare]